MGHKIYATARRRLIEIWEYTDRNWGVEQADRMIQKGSLINDVKFQNSNAKRNLLIILARWMNREQQAVI
jgi:hypothetical protein